MGSGDRQKKTFLAVYDYGMGGVWVLVDARSPTEITRLYPELEVVTKRPDWMTEAELASLNDSMHFDINEPPKGWLEELVKQRSRDLKKSEETTEQPRSFLPQMGYVPGFAVMFFLHFLMLFICIKELLSGVPYIEATTMPLMVVSSLWIVLALLRLVVKIDTVINLVGLAGVFGTVLLLLVRVVQRLIEIIT